MPPSGLRIIIFAICSKVGVFSRSANTHNAIDTIARGDATKSATFHLFPFSGGSARSRDNPVTLSRIVDARRRCHRLGPPMPSTDHNAIDDAHNKPSPFVHRSGNCHWGYHRGSVACGRLRGRRRTMPVTDPIRFRTIVRARVIPQRVVDRKQPVLCDKCQFPQGDSSE